MPAQPPSPKPSSKSAPPISNEKKPRFVLDAFAIMALIEKERGQERLAELLVSAKNGEIVLYLSLINWGEILYTLAREQGEKFAAEIEHDLERQAIILMDVDRTRVRAAARIKSRYRVSYADAFAIALAQELGATIVTGDTEFKALEKSIPILWL